MWIDETGDERIGQIGFLIEAHGQNGASRWHLSNRPAHTNESHEPRLYGWCGSTNNTSVHAHGLARVLRIAKNGRVKIERLGELDLDARAALETLGFPEL